MNPDLFILAAEPSADLQGAKLVEQLLLLDPSLSISAMAGPRMRALPIEALFRMEDLQVMGFIDVIAALPKIVRHFFNVRKKILHLNPKAVVCIDYPGFNLRLERSLRKKGYKGKLIHYICPTVWAWGKKRIPLMAKNLDLLLTLFPFEKNCFANTSLRVEYVGHPLADSIPLAQKPRTKLLALFPGSRTTEIEKNFPLQLCAAKRLMEIDPSMDVAISISHPEKEALLKKIAADFPARWVPTEENYKLMKECRLALATSGTVTLELALHGTPTVVNYAIRPFDVFLAQKIFQINLPFYCIVNIIARKEVFPEFFGPNLSDETLFQRAQSLWFNEEKRRQSQTECDAVRRLLGNQNGALEAAKLILSEVGPC